MTKAQVNGTSAVAEQPLSLAAGADLIARISAISKRREADVIELVTAVAEANRGGVCEAVEGLPIDLHLADALRWHAAETRMILDAGDALAAMPATLALWQAGIVSWSIVRDIIAAVRPLGRELRQVVDDRLHASRDLLADMTPTQIGWAVEDAVEEARGHRDKEKAEAQAERSRFLSFQLDIEGGARVYGELDALGTAVVTRALDAPTDDDPRPGAAHQRRRTRAQHRADALVGLAADALGGGCSTQQPSRQADPSPAAPPADGRCRPTRPARPLVVIHVPLDRITMTAAGLLEVAVPNALPRLSAALVDNLTRDADVRAVIFDGKRPLHVTTKTNATTIPTDTRLAVAARDLGARDPAGTTPIPLSHVHHLRRETHDPDQVVTASPRGHLRIIHRHGWTGCIDPPTGAITWARGHRTIRTLPWATRLADATTHRTKPRAPHQPPLPDPPE